MHNTIVKDIDLIGVLNTLQDAFIIVIDIDGIVLFLNKQTQDYKYLAMPILMGASFYECIPVKKRNTIRELLQNLLTSKLPFRTNVEIVEQGIKMHFEIRYSPVLDEFEKVTCVLIEGKNVTSEKIFSNKVKRVTNDFANLIENANAVIIGTDSGGYITDWNDVSEKLTGYTKKEAFTNLFLELLLDKKEQSIFSSLLKSILSGKLLSNYEIPILTKNGEQLVLLLNATLRKNYAGNIDGILFVGQDISELISYRKSLEEKVKERTLMLNESLNEIKKQKNIIESEREKSDRLLRNILPDNVAIELKETGTVIPKYYSQTTILFADLVGFTASCKNLTPQEIVYELTRVFNEFDFILERFGIEKIKTIGDGYLAVAGLGDWVGEHALKTVNAGLEMVDYLNRQSLQNKDSNKPSWQVRIGIHTGELVAGVIGRNKFAYDVWGASVNTASRMQSAGEPGKVNISSSTYELVKDQFKCEPRGSILIKNMGTIEMFFAS